MLRVVGGCAFQLLLYGIAQTPGMLLSTPGRLTGTSLWGPPEQFKHTPCIYLKLRGPELCLSAFDYPISGQSLDDLNQAHRNTLERKDLLEHPDTGLCPLVERRWVLLAGAEALALGNRLGVWVENGHGPQPLMGSIISAYVGQAGEGTAGRGGLYPFFQGSLHYENHGGRIPSGHPRDGMVGTTHHNACVQPACIEIHIACSPPCLTSNWGLRHGKHRSLLVLWARTTRTCGHSRRWRQS